MNIISIIEKKRDKKILNENEIDFFIESLVNDKIPDYQTSALLMAIYLNGMNDEETIYLTQKMLKYSERIPKFISEKFTIDKHSTGGIGDKTSLILLPILASLDIPVVKMSGKGLGITGGTLDKLESIPGFRIELTKEEIEKQSSEIGMVICSQNKSLVKADKILYALRDVTATVNSIPLICSSIMSKKMAIENDGLIIDLKVGKGAFIKDLNNAKELSRLFHLICKDFNRKLTVIISNMDVPLGNCIGNSLEILETIEILSGQNKGYLYNFIVNIAAESLLLSKKIDILESKKLVENCINSGEALNKFKSFIAYQGGDLDKLISNNYNLSKEYIIRSNKSGYINNIDAEIIGNISLDLGAGRLTKDSKVDYGAGIKLHKNLGDYVNKDDTLASIYSNKNISGIEDYLIKAFNITDKKIDVFDYILEVER